VFGEVLGVAAHTGEQAGSATSSSPSATSRSFARKSADVPVVVLAEAEHLAVLAYRRAGIRRVVLDERRMSR